MLSEGLHQNYTNLPHKSLHLGSGVHKSFHPTIRDGSTWSKFGARGEHGDVLRFSTEVFSVSPIGQLRCALVLGEPCSGFKDHNQRGGEKWRMYHSDETRFYQTDDSKVTRRLLKEKSKLTFVDV